MPTRATYEITDLSEYPRHNPVFLYIHHDGYPEGAACYFYNMLMHHHKTGDGYAESMIRANDRTEFTQSHECHGDTEYRWLLRGGGKDELPIVVCFVRSMDGDKWGKAFETDIYSFVNHHGDAMGDDFRPFIELTKPTGQKWWTNTTTADEYKRQTSAPALLKAEIDRQ